MLKKSERIHRSRFKNGRSRPVSFLYGSLRILSLPAEAAVVVSKKVSTSAVKRNLLRRRIQAILRPLFREKKLRSGIIIYPNKAALLSSFQTLKKELEKSIASIR